MLYTFLVYKLGLETRQLSTMARAGLGKRIPVFLQTRHWGLKHLNDQLDELEDSIENMEHNSDG